MFNEIPYQKTEGVNATLTIILGMTPKVLPRESEQAEAALEILTSGLSFDEQTAALNELLNPAQVVADKVDDNRITVEYNRVLFDGENLPTSLSSKLLAIVKDGLDITPWKRFVIRLFSNPSRGAQAELNEFLESGHLPITADGCFLAYKRVKADYTDVFSGKFDNSIGKVVEMQRKAVDPDRDRTCSYGLHFCSQDYLRNFYGGAGRIVIVKVNPADVVSIPSDYRFTKGRTCRYEVVGEVDLSAENAGVEWGIYDDSFAPEGGWDLSDWDEEEEDDYCAECGEATESDELDSDGVCEYCADLIAAENEVEDDDTEEDGVVTPPPFDATYFETHKVENKQSRLARLRAKFRS